MVKRVVCFALGGHISTQNASFKRLAELLEPRGYEFFGAEDGFNAFETGRVYGLTSGSIPKDLAGFVSGAGRAKLGERSGSISAEKCERVRDFFRRGRFDVAVGSGGDDHGMQMACL